ncbi:hypothetical protein M758_2G128200 [Ceratodon purpureus]|nr:hypothetical protein M758_2G128200 [Ceratodon purpureus]KAG0626464.1 hypothetical protein M758_2G128200 [Ceratodon purpureus]
MARFAPLLLALVLLFQAGDSLGGDILDASTHNAAPPATSNWTGHESKLVGLDVYVSGSTSASAAVLMVSDVFGWKAPLFRKLADKIAASGYYVVAPDYFRGDPLVNVSDLATWLVRHPPAAEVETTYELVDALKKEGFHNVGLAGFCWGGKVAILSSKQTGRVKVLVQAHPAFATYSDYAEVAVPISILASPTDGLAAFKGLLKKRRKEHLKVYLKIFTHVEHGWTIRYNETDKEAVKKANKAHLLMIKWFHKYLH